MQRPRAEVARRCAAAAALGACALLAPDANAGGYDTPILYSARHQGMGGTAIGFVSDPSAVLHNPAGLSHIQGLGLIGNFSFLTGHITSSPGFPDGPDQSGLAPPLTSERIIAPLFLLGAGYRINEWATVGLGIYPVASAAAEYRSSWLAPSATGAAVETPTIDKTRLVFLEASPAVSFDLPSNLTLGVGYRATYVMLERQQGNADNPGTFDFSLSGVDLTGWRLGLQWSATEQLSLGAVYRHRIDPELTADRAVAVQFDIADPTTTFTLPSKLGVGGRFDLEPLAFALDLEYGLNSQNERSTLSGYNTELDKPEAVESTFEWKDSLTARLGVEAAITEAYVARTGYIFDGQVSVKEYPSAFGTPPAPSHSVTVGGGYRADGWQTNIAAAYRFASTSIAPSDVATDSRCGTCSKPGDDYSLGLIGLYVDASIEL